MTDLDLDRLQLHADYLGRQARRGLANELRALIARVRQLEQQRDAALALHKPDDEETEAWADDGNEERHDRLFPDCKPADCQGHTFTIQVCQECGYEHDGETPMYRGWPCPTVTTLRGDQ